MGVRAYTRLSLAPDLHGAVRPTHWLQQSVVYREDTRHGGLAAESRQRILAEVGNADAVLDEIVRLLAGPSWLASTGPLWDPIRDHSRRAGSPSKRW